MAHKTPEDRARKKTPCSMGTGNGRKKRFSLRAAWATVAVLSSLGIAWGAPVVPTSSGMQTLQQVYDYENRQLIKDYNQLFSSSKPSAQSQLSAHEITWIQEKRAACGTVAKAQQSTQGLGCLIQHTDQRIVQIRQQEYGVGSSGSPASPTAPVISPTGSTGSAVFLSPCPTPGASASGGINWDSNQSVARLLKKYEAATPPSVSAACPADSCCIKNSALPEQQAAQTQCAPVTGPTASTKSASDCNVASKLSVSSYYENTFLPSSLGEGYVLHYYDVDGGCTVGVGHLVYYPQQLCPIYTPPKNKKIKSTPPPIYLNKLVSPSYVEKLKKQDVYAAEECVRQNLRSVRLSQCEFNSLVDVAFNAGCGGAAPIFKQVLISQKTGNYDNTANAIKNRGFGVPNREARQAKIFYSSTPGVCNHNNASDLCE